jgi:hypothetical protein
LCVGIVLRNFREVAARVEHFLRGEDADERHLDGGFYADALLVGFNGGELCLLAEYFAAETEFASGDDGLLNEEAFFAAADGAAATFIAGVADDGIRVEAGLLLTGFGGADLGFGLAESWIVLARDILDLIEGDQRGFCGSLGAAKFGVVGADERDVAVVVVFVGLRVVVFGLGHGHLHGLILGVEGRGEEKEEDSDEC